MTSELKILPKSAQVVQAAVDKKGFSFQIKQLSSSTRTVKDAATTLGCTQAQIVKSLLFHTKESDQPVLVLASGINRVNEKTIKQLVGQKIVKADADFTREITGFAIGGVPPLGHRQPIAHIFIDEDLLKCDTVWAAAGTPNAVFSFNSSDIQKLTDGKVISIN